MGAEGMTPELVAGVAREIDAWRGARVRSVHQDGPRALRLDLRGEAGRRDLVVALGAPFPRVHLAAARPAPATPSALASALRARLAGARVEGARAVAGERALCLDLRRAGEPLQVWLELFGGQSNLYVLDGEGVVLLTPRGEVARRRAASKGQAFEPVPPRGEPAAPEEDASARVEALAGAGRTRRRADSAQGRLRRFLKRRRAASQKAVERLEEALEGERRAEGLHRRGELLRAAFHLLRPGLARVRVPDYGQDPPVDVEVELDPGLPPGEQVATCFRRERKLRRAAELARERLAPAAAEREALDAALEQVRAASTDEELRALVAALPAALRPDAARELAPPAEGGARRAAGRAVPWRTFVSADGWRILVGRDARGNDELSLRHAAPGDLLVHVRGATGSHVIVPTPRGKTVPGMTLLDAAELACHFSERRKAEHNEVDYTPRRHVRKPRGAAPGLVVLQQARTLSLRRDEARRARLLASRAP